jgi:peroxiredoxin
MNKYLLSLMAVFLLLTGFVKQPDQKEVKVVCEMEGCVAALKLYKFDGISFSVIMNGEETEEGVVFMVPKSEPRFYYVGMNEQMLRPVILGTEDEVKLTGRCNRMRSARVTSQLNRDYDNLKNELNGYNRNKQQLIRKLQQTREPEQVKTIKQKIKVIDDQQLGLLDSLDKTNAYFAKVVGLNIFPSFENYGQNYTNGLDYFANEFFQFADFNEEIYGRLPWTYEAYKSYTTTISSVGLPDEKHKQIMEIALKRVPESSEAYKLAIGGILAALNQKNHANYAHFAKMFIGKYKAKDPKAAGRLENELRRKEQLMVGGEAPDFSGQSPEGETIALSDLRGKVVLIDFWASWCGPCRRENPNVVKMYNKYKSKGFEILGVSLDSSKDRWVGAIEQDGLTWPHISDLKKWQSEYAKLYGVRSIPHTVLLDAEGKIVARGLRGVMLENKVAEILGEQ